MVNKIYAIVFSMAFFDNWENFSTQKYFRNLVKSNRNQIVFTMFQFEVCNLIWNTKSSKTMSFVLLEFFFASLLNILGRCLLFMCSANISNGIIYDWKSSPKKRVNIFLNFSEFFTKKKTVFLLTSNLFLNKKWL